MLLIKNFINLFYPKLCIICNNLLLENENYVCTICRHDLPILYFKNSKKNTILEIFYGKIPIEEANTLLSFTKEGKTKKLIHQLKYKGNESVGEFLGNWLGELIIEKSHFLDIDYIVPVPLHSKKFKKRGYNQVTKFGKRISFHLKKPLEENILLRTFSSKTQTFKQRFERFENIDTQFLLTDKNIFANKHILLIDDVVTTGATLEACSKELLKAKNIKISILTMSFTT